MVAGQEVPEQDGNASRKTRSRAAAGATYLNGGCATVLAVEVKMKTPNSKGTFAFGCQGEEKNVILLPRGVHNFAGIEKVSVAQFCQTVPVGQLGPPQPLAQTQIQLFAEYVTDMSSRIKKKRELRAKKEEEKKEEDRRQQVSRATKKRKAETAELKAAWERAAKSGQS